MHSNMLVLGFPRDIGNEPIIANLVRHCDLTFNILKATAKATKVIESFLGMILSALALL